MDKGKVVIFTDRERNIPYTSSIPHYELVLSELNRSEDPVISPHIRAVKDQVKAYIIDVTNQSRGIEIVSKLRKYHPHASIMWVEDVIRRHREFPFNQLLGNGIFRIFYYRKEYPDELFAEIQSIIHPEYSIKKGTVAFILPIFNEEKRFSHIHAFLTSLTKMIERNYLHSSIYFIDDASSDQSKRLLNEYRDIVMNATDTLFKIDYLKMYELEQNTKKAGLFIEGMTHISSEYYVFVDADNSFKVDDIAQLLSIAENDYYDLVIGTKDMTIEDRNLIRTFVSFTKRLITKPFLPKGVSDSQTGLKIVNRRAIPRLLPYLSATSGFAIDLEMMYAAKKERLRVYQQPVTCIEREGSHVDLVKDSIAFLKTMGSLIRRQRALNRTKR
ncbi:glycosyltransferase [Exiguobacterium sp. SL-10]|uniref:glycosyltransferase n=1 Tax=unclassified Exiguobacterium TaxID=2644629 RepID=UPI00103CD9A2|nr:MULTISPECIES: glycosyltransferase [unclassified Exiguobacterium]TCI21404.1 glycosyltransferase [Exiguobacterium sp. SL-9]TCI30019.1 glycosyltransferase [Exiguobacterium sp. SL-10]